MPSPLQDECSLQLEAEVDLVVGHVSLKKLDEIRKEDVRLTSLLMEVVGIWSYWYELAAGNMPARARPVCDPGLQQRSIELVMPAAMAKIQNEWEGIYKKDYLKNYRAIWEAEVEDKHKWEEEARLTQEKIV